MAKVVVVPYSSEWPVIFAEVREELISVFSSDTVSVEHTGSTSVHGLAAKPVIDVLLGAESLAEIESKIKALAAIGYEYVEKYEKEIPQRRYFVKSSVSGLRVHVHGVARGARLWQAHLAFRDALRTDSALRNEYQSLKLQFAIQFTNDKASYTAAKDPFVKEVMKKLVGASAV